MTSRQERLQEFLSRLNAAPSCASAEEAMALVHSTLNEVEDERSGIAFNPEQPMNDGRMYPPGEDARREIDGRADLSRYRSRKHNLYISDDGALRIEVVSDRTCLLNKPAHNGRMIEL
jgi:hypothetical protein